MGIESIPASSVMTRNVITETDDQNIQAACKIMNERNIGSVIIVKGSSASLNKKAYSNNNQEPLGIITERDVVRLMGLLQPYVLNIPLRDLMSKPIITLSANNSIKDAMQALCFQAVISYYFGHRIFSHVFHISFVAYRLGS